MTRTLANEAIPIVVVTAAGILLWAFEPLAAVAMPPKPVLLKLPANATINTTKGQSVSGVRLLDVSPSRITYEKGGKRSLAAAEVKSIAFLGKVLLRTNGNGPIRGVPPRGCQPTADEVLVATAALAIQPDGTSLALLPAQLPKMVRMDLQQTSQGRTLVVDQLRFDPGDKVRVVYKACAPEA